MIKSLLSRALALAPRGKRRPLVHRRGAHLEWLEGRVLLALDSGLGPGPAPEVAVPDFALQDNNKTSATYGQDVSPRDYLGQASGWYFGHAT